MSELTEMSCEEFADVAAELALGVLTGRERARAIGHLDECDTCREHVRQLSLTGEEMLGLLPSGEPPAGFETRVMGGLGHTTAAQRPKRTRLMLAAAAGLAGAIAGNQRGSDDVALCRPADIGPPAGREDLPIQRRPAVALHGRGHGHGRGRG